VAITFHSGFEMGLFGEWTATAGTVNINASVSHTGAYSFKNTAGAFGYIDMGVNNKRFSLWYRCDAYPVGGDEDIVAFSGAAYCRVAINTSGQIKFIDGTTTVLYTSAALTTGQWYRISGSINGTSCYCWIDGSIVVDGTTVTGTTWNSQFGSQTGQATYSAYIDDIACDSAAGAGDIGDVRCATVANPNAAGQYAQYDTLVGGSGGVHYTAWDDPAGTAVTTMDDDYTQQAGKAAVAEIGNLDSCSDIGLGGGDVIDAVNVMTYCKGAATSGIRVRTLAGTDYDTVIAPSGSNQWLSRYYAVDPASAAWTQTNFNGFQAGRYTGSHSTDDFLYCVMVFVAYHAGSSGTTYENSCTEGLKVNTSTASMTRTLSTRITEAVRLATNPPNNISVQNSQLDRMMMNSLGRGNLSTSPSVTESLRLNTSTASVWASFAHVVAETLRTQDATLAYLTIAPVLNNLIRLTSTPTATGVLANTVAEMIRFTTAGSGRVDMAPVIAQTLRLSTAVPNRLDISPTVLEAVRLSSSATTNQAYLAAIAEALRLADAPHGTVTLSPSVLEALRLADANDDTLQMVMSLTEALRLTDATSSQVTFMTRLTEVLRIADASFGAPAYTVIIAEALRLADVNLNSLAASALITEVVRLLSAPDTQLTSQNSVTEALRLVDVSSTTLTISASVLDAFRMSDATSSVVAYVVNVLEAIRLWDLSRVAVTTLETILLSVSEALRLADMGSAGVTAAATLLESLRLNDMPYAQMGVAMTLADIMRVIDNDSLALTVQSNATDTIALNDASIAGLTYLVSVLDRVAVSDGTGTQTTFSVTAADSIRLIEGINTVLTIYSGISEHVTLSDIVIASRPGRIIRATFTIHARALTMRAINKLTATVALYSRILTTQVPHRAFNLVVPNRTLTMILGG
jgi:hypothetical protein